MLIRLTGNARVTVDGDRAAICTQLDGVESVDSFLQHVPRSLTSLGLEGGRIALEYNAKADSFTVVTEFRAPQPLTGQQLKELQECTAGQWSDGLGAGCFEEVGNKLAATIELLPVEADDTITVSQVDDGKTVKQKCAVYHAASDGDLNRVKELLGGGANIEEAFEHCTPLHTAVLGGHRDVAIELIHRGADVFATDESGCDALIFTALSNRLDDGDASDIAQALLEQGVSANGERDGLTPLFMARNRSKTSLESVLIKYGATD